MPATVAAGMSHQNTAGSINSISNQHLLRNLQPPNTYEYLSRSQTAPGGQETAPTTQAQTQKTVMGDAMLNGEEDVADLIIPSATHV